MNKSQRWHWLVLISSMQLIVLLLALVSLYFWQSQLIGRVLDQQSNASNIAVVDRVSELIEEQRVLNIRNIRAGSNQDLERLDLAISNANITSNSFVALYDYAERRLIKSFSSQFVLDTTDLLKKVVYSTNDGTSQGRIETGLSNEIRQLSGLQVHDDEKSSVAARFLPRLNAILVVAQPPQISTASTASLFGVLQLAHSRAFTITLVVGLIGISITMIIVSRVRETVNSLNDGLEKVVSNSTSELIRTKNAVIFGLAKLAESRDNDTGEHLERIRIYVTILAKQLALSRPDFDERFIHDLGLASSLHDIGKVGIPDSILLKPGRLTPEERGIMELHTLIGGECLDAIQARLGDNEFMNIARQIAYYHHEKWDGTGYPNSLKGAEIPLVARIVAVADVYDALTSKRPYKRAMSHAESKEIIVAGSGKHFDSEIVEAFLIHEKEFEAVSIHQQSLSDEQATSNFQRLCEAARASGDIAKISSVPVSC